jgi:hypothetical protein
MSVEFQIEKNVELCEVEKPRNSNDKQSRGKRPNKVQFLSSEHSLRSVTSS